MRMIETVKEKKDDGRKKDCRNVHSHKNVIEQLGTEKLKAG